MEERGERSKQKNVIDYIGVGERLRKDALDFKMVRDVCSIRSYGVLCKI